MRVHTLLLLCLAAAAAAPASAAKKCGVRNRNKPCADRRACCNKKGYCGKSAPYCAAINCVSGPCQTWEDAIQKLICGVLNGGKPCQEANKCCSTSGTCGTSSAYCGVGKCVSGPCQGGKPKPKPPPPSPRPPKKPKPPPPSPRPPKKPRPPPSPKPPRRSRPPPPSQIIKPVSLSPPPPSPLPPQSPSPPPPSPVLPQPSPPPPPPSPSPPSPFHSPPPSPSPPSPLAVFPGDLGNATTQYSWLWGRDGELWTPTGRLPDWSYAGYMANERPIPSYPVQFNVLAYGAKGDGVADDTKAVLAALKAASAAAARLGVPKTGMGNEGQAGVAVLLPAGRYRITQFIELTQSNVAVRGEGVDKTVLYFPRALQHVYGNLMAWSYMGGFLTCRGRRYDSAVTQFQLARVTGAARKGDRRLSVDTTRGITAGRWIRLYATKPLATGPRRQLLGEEQEGRERVKVQVEPWEAEAEMELWEEEEEPQPQPISRRQLTEKQQATSEDDGGSSSGSSKKKGSKRRMCGRKGDRHRCRRIRKAMKEWEKEAEALGLGQPEVPGASSSGEEGDEQGGEKAPATSAAGTLDAYIFFNNAVDSGKSPFGGERIRFISRVSAVGSGWIELERPLPYDLRPEWQVAVYSFEHSVQHVGYEDFTVEFQWDTYPAHFGAKGYNAFRFQSCANAWIRNVRIIDADNGAESINCDLITMQNITLEFTRNRGNKGVGYSSGHHGLWAAASSLVHFTDLTFKGRFIHDLTLDVWSQECAYTNSRGVDMSMDMHRGGVHNNLWSNIDVGLGSRTFQSSGAASKGAHAAANNTWWNIYASSRPTASLAIPDCGYGPLLNYVGGFGPPAKGAAGIAGPGSPAGTPTPLFPAYCTPGVAWWVEQKRAGAALSPPDLFPAMVATRQQRLAIPAVRRPKN